jgi:hypothetical protein
MIEDIRWVRRAYSLGVDIDSREIMEGVKSVLQVNINGVWEDARTENEIGTV